MFTGIIRHVGLLRDVSRTPAGARLRIDLGPLAAKLTNGDSVAVNGACLTVAALAGGAGEFDVVAETLARTTLSQLRAGAKVNLETALRASDALDGHLVQGHVDGTAKVRTVPRPGQSVMEFDAPRELTDWMVPKGSVAIDGVSLTLASLADGRFGVALIPTTLAETTLGGLAVGDKVNIETDVIGKYVRRCLRQLGTASQGLTVDKLADMGFQ